MKRFLVLGLMLVGCAGADGADGANGKSGRSAEVDVSSATAAQCPAGGSVIEVGVGDDTEEVVVCNGAEGAQGEPGPAGGLGSIETSMLCQGNLPDVPGMRVLYDVVVFEDSSVWVSAEVSNGVLQVSGSRFYSPDQVGATVAGIALTLDAVGTNNGGFWSLVVSAVTLDTALTYTDSDLEGGLKSWTLPASACTVNSY